MNSLGVRVVLRFCHSMNSLKRASVISAFSQGNLWKQRSTLFMLEPDYLRAGEARKNFSLPSCREIAFRRASCRTFAATPFLMDEGATKPAISQAGSSLLGLENFRKVTSRFHSRRSIWARIREQPTKRLFEIFPERSVPHSTEIGAFLLGPASRRSSQRASDSN